ncbi:MAG TPA: peptidase S8 [Cyanobacteria bacterium UBA11049]|nr:peptidase S8 [Cyanobacteria bacterium UBA11049]
MAIVDTAGNTLGVAFDLGSLSASTTVSDFVGSTDTVDFFRISLNTASDFDLSLNGLSANAEVALIQDRNFNGVIDANEYVGLSNRFGTAKDTIDINSLPSGTYYAGVYHSGGDTNYNLSLSATPPGKTFNSNYGYGLVDAATSVAFVTGASPFPEVANLGGFNWGLDMVKAPEVWQQGYTGSGITVAVLDTGVDYTHADLDNNIWINSDEVYGNAIDDDKNGYVDDVIGWDFVDGDNLPYDQTFDGHGTHVAGLIAAENNNFGTTGVAYNAKIMPVKISGVPQTTANLDTLLANGINYAVANGANVLNMSVGNFPGDPLMPKTMEALANAKRSGVVAVMASGNERITYNATRPDEPASYAAIDLGIAVGAVNAQDILDNYANPAGVAPIDYVVAPADAIYSTTPGNAYEQLSGTSMSTPYVSGVAALLLGANPSLSPSEVEMTITRTANPFGIIV